MSPHERKNIDWDETHQQNKQPNKQSKKEGKDQKDQESIQSDPGYKWESNKLTIRHHKREPRDQPFPRR